MPRERDGFLHPPLSLIDIGVVEDEHAAKMKSIVSLLLSVCASYLFSATPIPDFQNLAMTSVVVRIDGLDITKRDIVQNAKVLMTLTMNKSRHTKIGSAEQKLFSRQCRLGRQIAENRAIVSRYAQGHSLSNSHERVERIIRQVERQFGVRSKKLKRRHNLGDLKYMLGPNAGRLDAEIMARATYETVTNFILTTFPVIVTDVMISNRIASIVSYNQRMTVTNELVYARATNVWKRILQRELTFEQAATNFSEDVYIDIGCEWGTFSLDQLADDPSVLAILPSLKIGGVTPPLESDGGLAILRLDAIEQGKNYTFSRVFFRLPMFFDQETQEEAAACLKRQMEMDLVRRKLEETRAKMRFEYPCGTNLFANGSALLRITKEDLSD